MEDADMRNAIVVLLGALSVLACSKEKPPENANVTTTTRSGMPEPSVVSVEEVRTNLLEKQPTAADSINALVITNDGGIITLRGKVEDEATHANLVNRTRAMPGVRGVRDEIQVVPKSAAAPSDTSGTTTATGAMGGGAGGTMGQGGGMGGTQQQQGTMGGSTMGGSMGGQAMGTKSDAVRQSMEKARPKSQAVIQGLTITDDGSMVTVAGMVPDETTHQALIKAAKDTPGVKGVQDDIKVEKKQQKK
jgi:osmotically-inducible protein OsmY